MSNELQDLLQAVIDRRAELKEARASLAKAERTHLHCTLQAIDDKDKVTVWTEKVHAKVCAVEWAEKDHADLAIQLFEQSERSGDAK